MTSDPPPTPRRPKHRLVGLALVAILGCTALAAAMAMPQVWAPAFPSAQDTTAAHAVANDGASAPAPHRQPIRHWEGDGEGDGDDD